MVDFSDRERLGEDAELGASVERIREATLRYMELYGRLSDPPTFDEMTEVIAVVRERRAACLEQVRMCDIEIGWGEPLLRAHRQTLLRDSREQQRADAAAAKLDRVLEKSRRQGLKTGHACDGHDCSRNARFFTETGNWCKRHVPDGERPKGKVV